MWEREPYKFTEFTFDPVSDLRGLSPKPAIPTTEPPPPVRWTGLDGTPKEMGFLGLSFTASLQNATRSAGSPRTHQDPDPTTRAVAAECRLRG